MKLFVLNAISVKSSYQRHSLVTGRRNSDHRYTTITGSITVIGAENSLRELGSIFLPCLLPLIWYYFPLK